MTFLPKSDFLRTMVERGFFHSCSDLEDLDHNLRTQVVPAYIGFDATAQSLHAGSLIQIMMLRWLQKTGHKPIVLMGGGTTKVGDPSFRASERPLLDMNQIEANITGIKQVFERFIDFNSKPTGALQVNNAEWLDNINYIEFLRDIGKHFSVNRMLAFESVKTRLDREQSLSFLEFNYMILQAYDFLELSRRYHCVLQMGGSDQWGNILNGVDLTRRVINRKVFALTSPLLTTSEGKKMGKTAGGAVWLNANLYTSYDFWQYWRNTDDADVSRFLKLYTELPLDECNRLSCLQGAELNEAKIILANEITSLTHGREAALNAQETSANVFEKGMAGSELPKLVITSMSFPLTKALVDLGFATSGKEAKRHILGQGIRINNCVETDIQKLLTQSLGNPIKISFGRKRHALIYFQQ
ncbi:MAG: tyrosine--tRNA ligase [Rhodobacteraceae bacterium]|nr:tyrosine--tRNA ligase [Paracoccaceae bacterium]